MDGISALKSNERTCFSVLISPVWGCKEKFKVLNPEEGFSPETDRASIQISDFQPPDFEK